MSVDTNLTAPDAIKTGSMGGSHSSLVDTSVSRNAYFISCRLLEARLITSPSPVTNWKSSADQAGLSSFQFRCPGSEFDFTVTPPAYPDGDGNPGHGVDQSLSHSSDSSKPSSCNSTPPSGLASLSQNLRCDNTLLANGGDVSVSTDCDEASCSATERGNEPITTAPGIDPSLENISGPLMAQGELTVSQRVFSAHGFSWVSNR